MIIFLLNLKEYFNRNLMMDEFLSFWKLINVSSSFHYTLSENKSLFGLDFSTVQWVEVDNLGGQALFFHDLGRDEMEDVNDMDEKKQINYTFKQYKLLT